MDDARQTLIPIPESVGLEADRKRRALERWADIEGAWLRSLEPQAVNTRRTYAAAWKRWLKMCDDVGLEPLPIHPVLMIGYLQKLSETHAPASVRIALNALASIDVLSRRTPQDPSPLPLTRHTQVTDWLANWNRSHPRAPRKRARALRAEDLLVIVRQLQERPKNQSAAAHVVAYCRDRAILLMAVCFGLRASELGALNVGDVETTPRGLVLTVRRSKTDQEGRGATCSVLPQSLAVLCPVDAWRAWIAVRGERFEQAAFLGISRAGELLDERLTVRSIQRVITSCAERAGYDGVSSHSMRRTMATLMREQGKRLEQIQAHGRWRSLETMRGYISQRELFEDSPTGGLLDVQ